MITKSDYLSFAGVDLDFELKKSNYDNPTRAVEIFISKTETLVNDWIKYHFFVDYNTIDEETLKKVYLYQIEYILKNGEVTYDITKKEGLSPNAYAVLRAEGYLNTRL